MSPRSRTVTRTNFRFGRVVKNTVYARQLRRLEERELYIDDAFSDADGSMKLCETVRASVLGKLSVSVGGHSEYFKRSVNGGTVSVQLTCCLKCQETCEPLCMGYSNTHVCMSCDSKQSGVEG